ncbi:hypothetical protein [Dongshaea marina]|uniref:hypothetical protein n=1 Tax=Dongshaea marina TaxID=2047966 RepID=UPI000D3E8568|nr:hypothetical protein [Dongshaea marina]
MTLKRNLSFFAYLVVMIGGLILLQACSTASQDKPLYKKLTSQQRAAIVTQEMTRVLSLNDEIQSKILGINLLSTRKIQDVWNSSLSPEIKQQKVEQLMREREQMFKQLLSPVQMKLYYQRKDELKEDLIEYRSQKSQAG